jgi:ferredoxin
MGESVITVTAACRGCGACLLTCPERAIRPAVPARPGAGPLAVLAARCTGCGECGEICPADAIEYASPGGHPAGPGAPRPATGPMIGVAAQKEVPW